MHRRHAVPRTLGRLRLLAPAPEILVGSELTATVLGLIATAETRVVIASRHLDPSSELILATASALRRGVEIRFVTQVPEDGPSGDRARWAIRTFERVGARVGTVSRLDTNVCVARGVAVVSSSRLVTSQRRGDEYGVRLHDLGALEECLRLRHVTEADEELRHG